MNKRALILGSLLLAAFAINLDTTIVNVALPTLVLRLHASNSQLQWVVDAYNLVFAALLLAAGSLSDRLGRKGMLLAGLTIFGLSSLAGGFASSAGELIAARCLMGLGAAAVFPATLSLISNVFVERKERALAIGLWGATAGMAIALGPIVGGALLERFSWSSIFFAMAPVAAVLGVAFARWELRAQAPMLDISLFRNLRFTAASSAVTVSFFTLFGFIFLITQYFQFFKGYGPLSAGVHLLPVAASVGAASVLGTRLAVRYGTKLIVTTGLLAMAAFYAWASTTAVSTSYTTIAVQMVIYGIGMGLTSAPSTEAIMGAVPITKAGVGSAVNDAPRLLGGTLGVAIIGSVYASLYGSRLSSDLPDSLPAPLAHAAHQSAGAALTLANTLGAT